MSEILGKRPSKSRAYYKRSLKKRKFGATHTPHLLYAGPGVRGILITTGDKVKLCVPEAYNLLNEYGDQLYGAEKGHLDTPSDSEGSDEEGAPTGGHPDSGIPVERPPDAGTSKECPPECPAGGPPDAGTQPPGATKEKPRRFLSMDSGAKHLVFIRCSDEIDPTHLVHTMLMDIHTTKVMKSRFCQRILPVVRVCHASLEDIRKCALEVLEPHFHCNTTDSYTFAVNYKSRNNNAIKRDHVITLVADLVTMEDQYPHRVNFDNPELTVIVEIIRNLCCLSVVKDFSTLRKYNIQSLTAPPLTPPPGTKKEKQEEMDSEKTVEAAELGELGEKVVKEAREGEKLPETLEEDRTKLSH